MKKSQQPIAVVGMACRFPGSCNSPDQFWEMLCSGTDVITEIKDDRWSRDYYYHPDPKTSGKSYTVSAGQLSDIYKFDPEFFGISPREAAQMDPQQRLLLQMSWEALEYGGQVPSKLAGSDCSVYVGISSLDYANNRMDDPNVADAYFMTGNTLSIAANRISYIYDLHGPSMAIDTACSSSLVALHQACSSIWSGESSSSIVGAVHLVLSPFPFIGFSKANMLSNTGRCQVFDASADGYVRSEGGVVFYLKPYEQAIKDGDPVHALIRGTGVNSDGTKSALTVPNGIAQSRLLDEVYTRAGVNIDEIDYIEAHGTGTPVGDPIEVEAIGRAIGSARSADNPLLIGSVKSNIGHLEPASGFAGLLKVILSLKHRLIPPTIHQNQLNPNIDFTKNNIKVVNKTKLLDQLERSLIMGVNSFGFGGTNAHTILEEHIPNSVSKDTYDIDGIPPLFLSAQSEESLKSRAKQFIDLLNQELTSKQIYDIFYNSALKREQLKLSLVTFGDSLEVIINSLQNFIDGKRSANIVRMDSMSQSGGVAFVFSGNGSQWIGMGKELVQHSQFCNVIQEIDAIFEPMSGWSILDTISNYSDSGLEYTEVAQPLLFAIQVGIVDLLKSMGIFPGFVLGHSVGEIAAAYVAGALNLDDAVKVIFYRSSAQGKTKGQGRMAAVRLSVEDITPFLENHGNDLEIAAINSPNSVTVSGSTEAIRVLIDVLQEQSVTCRELDIDYAFHSNIMDSIKNYVYENLQDIKPKENSIDFISTISGKSVKGSTLNAEYWWENIRHPVEFEAAISSLIDQGVKNFVEIGPHPVLQSYIRDNLRIHDVQGAFYKTLSKNDKHELVSILGAGYRLLFSQKIFDLSNVFPVPGKHVQLPGYPWNNEDFIFTGSIEATNKRKEHPLLGFKLNDVDGVWSNHIDIFTHPYLSDHRVEGMIIFPAAGYAEMALAAAASVFDNETISISNFEIRKPLILENGKTKLIQFVLSSDNRFSIKSRDRLSTESWVEHATGKLNTVSTKQIRNNLDPDVLDRDNHIQITGADVYKNARICGLEYGENFQKVSRVVITNDERVFTEFDRTAFEQNDSAAYLIHPTILDSAFHSLFTLMQLGDSQQFPFTYLPTEINSLLVRELSDNIKYSECVIQSTTENIIHASFYLYDEDGKLNAELVDCVFRKLPRSEGKNNTAGFYNYKLIPKNLINLGENSPLPSNNDLISEVRKISHTPSLISSDLRLNEQILPLFDAMASAIAEKTFREFGAHLGQFTIASLIESSMVVKEYQPYLNYLLSILEQDGKAYRQDDSWRMVDSDDIDDPVEIWRSILADYPEYIGALREAANLGLRAENIISDPNLDTEDLQKGMPKAISKIKSPLQAYILENIVNLINQSWPKEKRRLRIAEIRNHSGTSGIDVLPQLSESVCDYEILAMDDYSFSHAEEMCRSNLNVTVSHFDPDSSGLHQKNKEGEFDIVILSDGFHACNVLRDVFSQVSHILASSGMLILLEQRPDRMADLNMGLVNSQWWHRSSKEEFPLSSRLHPEEWMFLLEDSDFEDTLNLTDEISKDLYHYVIVSRRPPRSGNHMLKIQEHTSTCLLITNDDEESAKIAKFLKSEMVKDGVKAKIITSGDILPKNKDTVSLDLLSENDQKKLQVCIEELDGPSLKIIYIAVKEDNISRAAFQNIGEGVSRTNIRLNNFINILASASINNLPPVWLVTSGAVTSSNVIGNDEQPNPYLSGLWAMGRVIRNEFPDVDLRMIDLKTQASSGQVSKLLWNEIMFGDGEEEIIISEQIRSALRLQKCDIASEIVNREKLQSLNKIYQLEFTKAGSIDNLQWNAKQRKLPAVDQIEIEVKATGLNFRDVMYTSGLLPPEMLEGGLSGPTLGLECSGVVTHIGEGIDHIEVGDEVIALAPACFSSHVIASKYAVTKKPEFWSFEAAATIPTTFFTVYYALNHMARLRKGEKILIHGAAGGVGIAAIQYAHHCGAEIFATAGTREKRQFLELLGVDHILDSRTLEFADEILAKTDNQGIDVVLNSLAGEAMIQNFKVLRPFGRFVELGKRDFYENSKLDLKPFRNNITYYGVDADQLLQFEQERSSEMMGEVMSLFEQGVFRPLPFTVFPTSDVSGAFRFMQQSHHIGKVVISHNTSTLKIHAKLNKQNLELNRNATYMVTGGLSGFGLSTANWLADKGARHLVLLSRSGSISLENEIALKEIQDKDVDVKLVACDITDAIKVQSVLHDIQESSYPLKGIVHAAMVLEDNLIKNMDFETMYNVIAPKVQGAWNLHRLTRDSSLDLFVMYSSVTTCLGNPGQVNYVAANAFLESLAKFRTKSGLPATVISWDAITDTGYLARNTKLAERITKRLGLGGIKSKQAFNAMETLIMSEHVETIVFNANWQALKRALPIINSHLFKDILHGQSGHDHLEGEDLYGTLSRLDDSERQPFIVNFLICEIARILQMPEEKIAHNCTIQDLGIDSLMAMELASTIENKLGINLPVMTLADNVTLDSLANRINNMLEPADLHGESNSDVDEIVTSLAKIHAENLTEDELKSISDDAINARDGSKRLIQ